MDKKLKRTTLTVKQKLDIIRLYDEKHQTKQELAQNLSCTKSTINEILQNKEKLRELFLTNQNLKRKRFRQSTYKDIDKAVTKWFDQMRLQGEIITALLQIWS